MLHCRSYWKRRSSELPLNKVMSWRSVVRLLQRLVLFMWIIHKHSTRKARECPCAIFNKFMNIPVLTAVAQLVEPLRYKLEGREFDSRLCPWYNPSGRTVALGSTQAIKQMSTRNISWGKGGRCVEMTTLPPACADCLEIWKPQPLGTLYRDYFTFTCIRTGNWIYL